MKKLFILAACCLPVGLWAQLQTADAAYDQGNFASALTAYEQAVQTATGPELYHAQLRVIASQFMLGQYMHAAQSAFSYELPAEALWQARLLLYRVATARRVKTMYRSVLNPSDEDTQDLEKLSPAQWQDKINESLDTLWTLRKTLLQAPIEKETLILNITDTDTRAIPTLFDFVVLTWKDALQGAAPAHPLRAADVLSLSYKAPAAENQDIQKLLSILTEAARLGGANRADARIIWEADRLTLPFTNRTAFTFENEAKEKAEAIRLLEVISGYQPEKKSFFSKISSLLKSTAQASYGKAYAAYQAANLLQETEAYEAATALCDWSVQTLGDNAYTQHCARLAADIRRPVLSVQRTAATQAPDKPLIPLRTRNVDTVSMRLYRVTEEDLLSWYDGRKRTSWDYLTWVSPAHIPQLLARTPLAEQSYAFTYDKPHAFAQQPIALPALTEPGFYAVALSANEAFDAEQAPVQVVLLNNTELALFVTAAIEGDPADYHTTQTKTFHPSVFRLYTLNLQTGQPEPHAAVTYFTDWNGTTSSGQTDANGLLALPRKIQLNGDYSSYRIWPKAVKNGNTALADTAYFSFHAQDPVKLYAETDRAFYRPGQTVQLAVYGFEQAGRGLKPLAKNTRITLTVRDSNDEKVLEQTLPLNAYGTARTELTLPDTGLLGAYPVEVSYQPAKRMYRGYTSFRVEEYKRPDYEVTLDPAAVLSFGKEAAITGTARYYFGSPLEKATVKYTVTRRPYYPPFWWWRHEAYAPADILASGETFTRKDGTFDIPFTPQPGADPSLPYAFEVAVSVSDASGRAIDAQQTYKAAQKSVFFSASFDKGFYDAQTESPLAQVKLLDVNGQPIAGKFTAEITQLENTLPAEANTSASLETWYAQNKAVRPVTLSVASCTQETPAQLDLPALPEGIYKLTLSAKNADPVELVFLVAAPQSNLALPAVAIAQQSTYYPGSQAKILIGAQKHTGPKYLEIYQDGQFLARTDRAESGVSLYTLPIEPHWRGGVQLRWFGASAYQFYQAAVTLQVPYDNKELALTMAVPDAVKPGQQVSWKLSARNATGSPVNGQASVRVYDKSLDYYGAMSPLLQLTTLYPQASWNTSWSDSQKEAFASSWSVSAEQDVAPLPDIQMPQLNLQPRWISYGLARSAVPRMALAKSAAVNTLALADAAAPQAAAGLEEAALETADDSARADSQLRTDFSETAYFNPMLPMTGGKAEAAFTLPQSVTAWNVQAFAITPDAEVGTFTAQTVTRKDVMVRLSLPRFWREGDQGTLIAQVTNVTDKKRSAEITLDLLVDGANAAEAFGLDKPVQTITIPAGGNTAVSWPVTVPSGVGVLTVTATVRSGTDTDGESRQLPLLPARARLAESTTAALDNGTQTLQLDNLLTDDDTRSVSSVTLRVDPGLLLSVFNAMPQLLRPGYNDALSLANRYVPLAVIHAFYHTYPFLQDAVAKLPARHSQTPAWNAADPARLVLLQETPWLAWSRGGAQQEAFLTDLFQPAAVQQARASTEKELANYQNADGGFAWMPGGPSSEFITLRLLSSFSQILRYGGDIPQDTAQKALAWLAPRIEDNLQKAPPSASGVAYALYAAYVFTAFPQDWQAVRAAPVAQWLAYADAHAAYMTPLGQTYAAMAYFRLGHNTKAQNYLDLVLSQMKTDPVTGAYFAPEAQSWLWYQDTLATQTATLRALLEIRPESDQAAQLVKWLLFNRKAQAWRDTTATAQVIYTLLEYMQRRGLLTDPAEYILHWGERNETLQVEPLDWTEQLAWTQQAPDISPQYYTAQVTKRGGMTGFVTLDAVYTTAQAAASQPGVLQVQRRYLLKYTEDGRQRVRALQPGEAIPAGAEVEVQLELAASSAFDFVLLSDPKPAGFENTDLLSGWTWDALSFYREVRDASTNFFINSLPAGTYTLRYSLRPTTAGVYHALPAQLQSMYAPEFSAHSAADVLEVKKD